MSHAHALATQRRYDDARRHARRHARTHAPERMPRIPLPRIPLPRIPVPRTTRNGEDRR